MVFQDLLPTILELISQHGVLAVMLGMVIEEVIVPIPSPAIPMAAGATESIIGAESLVPAILQIFFYIAIPASVASVVSSYFVYSVAFYGGKPGIQKYGKWLEISWEDVQHLEKHFDSSNEKYYVALFRALPIVPLSLVSGSAGLFRMDWKQYGIWSFIGMVPRNFGLALLGWYLKDGFLYVASRIDNLSTAVALLIVGIVGGFILYRKTQDLYKYILKKI